MDDRFQDELATIASFGDRFLVRCPACVGCATVSRGVDARGVESVRCTCRHCGHAAHWKHRSYSVQYGGRPGRLSSEGVIWIGAPCDWYFHHPLWLQADCSGETLWAYNEQHLDYLERYLAAKLRERATQPDEWVRNKSLVSRLPKWLIAARNREPALKAIKQLRETLAQV